MTAVLLSLSLSPTHTHTYTHGSPHLPQFPPDVGVELLVQRRQLLEDFTENGREVTIAVVFRLPLVRPIVKTWRNCIRFENIPVYFFWFFCCPGYV